MARPRVFVSSTFYDLRHVRADLEKAIRDLGYEPVLNERGSIPYSSSESLEDSCYQEVSISDILVSIIGGRYGTESKNSPYSITQAEIKKAIGLSKPVYIFVERSVLSEYETYRVNKEVADIRYRYVDDVKVYEFLEEISVIPNSNPIAPFDSSQDIINYLKEQWAGLFQRLLIELRRIKEYHMIEDMQSSMRTLNELITFLTEERVNKDEAIKDILLSNHPIFNSLRTLTKTPYRIYFSNHDEMATWLRVRGFSRSDNEFPDDEYETWVDGRGKKNIYIRISKHLFDEDGKLIVLAYDNWNDSYITREDVEKDKDDDGDDVPF